MATITLWNNRVNEQKQWRRTPCACVLQSGTFLSRSRPHNDVKWPNLRLCGGHEHLGRWIFNFLYKHPNSSYQFHSCNINTFHERLRIQRRAIRFVFNTYSWQQSVSALLQKLKWPDLSSLRKSDRVILMFKILKGLVAIPPEDYVTRSTTATRRKHDFKLNTFSPSLDVFKYSFFPRIFIDWNLLPAHVVHSTSVSQFRSQLDMINYEFL